MKVILPGSYDPVTLGHLDIIRQAAEKYDEVFVVAFINPNKNYRFSVDDQLAMLMLATEEFDNVLVSYSDGRVVDYMREHDIEKIVKGYRTDADLPWEMEQAAYNKKHGGFDTELIKCDTEFEGVSSTAVRERLRMGEDVSNLLPPPVLNYIRDLTYREG